jgi:hypothetical protein
VVSQWTAATRSPAAVWQAARAPLLIGLLVLAAAVVLTVARLGTPAEALDPRSAAGSGGRALAVLLGERGVRVDLARTAAEVSGRAGPGTTLLVTSPDLLAAPQRQLVAASEADLVLVAPGEDALGALAPAVQPVGLAPSDTYAPECALPTAQAAGPIATGGLTYSVPPSNGTGCYPTGEEAAEGVALVRTQAGGRPVTVLGGDEPLTNDGLAREGNAALALRLLGGQPRVVWYLPSLSEALDGERRSLGELLPDGVRFGLLQLAAAVVVIALWRVRRLGPVVAEPLPVVVRARETVEGRARLYRRARARDVAADALRSAARDRLAVRLGLPTAAEPLTIAESIAGRTGRSPAAVAALLYGAAPGDDAALVRLGSELDVLERELTGRVAGW